jgi:hypothetical protein
MQGHPMGGERRKVDRHLQHPIVSEQACGQQQEGPAADRIEARAHVEEALRVR